MTFISKKASPQQNSWGLSLFRLAVEMRRMFNEAIDRQRMKASLNNLSLKDLRDIGLTRNDVTSISHLPLPSSSALELSETRKSRTGNW